MQYLAQNLPLSKNDKQETCTKKPPETHAVQQKRIVISAQFGEITGLLYVLSPNPFTLTTVFFHLGIVQVTLT